MPFEKECDTVLRLLNTTNQPFHLYQIAAHLDDLGFAIEANGLISTLSILSSNEHILVGLPMGVVIDNATKEKGYQGTATISKKGAAFIAKTSYVNEQDRIDILHELNKTQIQANVSAIKTNRKTLLIVWGTLFITTVTAGTTIMDYVRETKKDLKEHTIQQMQSTIQSMNTQLSQTKKQNDSLNHLADSLLHAPSD